MINVGNICLLNNDFLGEFFRSDGEDVEHMLRRFRKAVNEEDRKVISELKGSCGGSFAEVFPNKRGYFVALSVRRAIVKNIIANGGVAPNYEIARYLIDSGCGKYYCDEYGNSALHYLALDRSIAGKAYELVEKIIDAWRKEPCRDSKAQMSQGNNLGLHPEAVAILSGNPELAAKINEFTKTGEYLIDYGLVAFLCNEEDHRPENHEELLLGFFKSKSSESLRKMFSEAVSRSDENVIKYFLKDKSPEDLNEMFLMAVLRGDKNVAKYLLNKDKVDVRNMAVAKGKTTPMCIAAYRNDVAILDLLRTSGANPDVADADGLTPMHHVINSPKRQRGDFAALKVLFACEANPYLKDKAGKAPLDLAIELKDSEVVKKIAKNIDVTMACLQENLEDLIEIISDASTASSPPLSSVLESAEGHLQGQSLVESVGSPPMQFKAIQSFVEAAYRPGPKNPIPLERHEAQTGISKAIATREIPRPVARRAAGSLVKKERAREGSM